MKKAPSIFSYLQSSHPDPRLDMEERLRLPRRLLDWFTGKPLLDGKSKRNRLGPVSYLALDIGIIGAATVAAASVATHAPLWAALPALGILWPIQTGRLRKMQTLEGHEAAHGNFFMAGDPRRNSQRRILGLSPNDFLGELATSVALSPNIVDYKADHDLHHAIPSFTTKDDPDTEIVQGLRRYGRSLLNPTAYLRDFAGRLRSNLITARPVRRAMAIGVLALLLAPLAWIPVWAWLAAVFMPWVVLFRLAGALQILSLHDWRMTKPASLQDYADRTWARFSGVPLPARGLRGLTWLKAWALWWSETLFVELPFRAGVLSPDLQAHDAHHLEWLLVHNMEALSFFQDDWRNQPYRRAEIIRDSGDPLGMVKREHWGVRSFMKLTWQNIARLGGSRW